MTCPHPLLLRCRYICLDNEESAFHWPALALEGQNYACWAQPLFVLPTTRWRNNFSILRHFSRSQNKQTKKSQPSYQTYLALLPFQLASRLHRFLLVNILVFPWLLIKYKLLQSGAYLMMYLFGHSSHSIDVCGINEEGGCSVLKGGKVWSRRSWTTHTEFHLY